ncbi:g2681 [Coccomyxa viridis]|uniref:G2681 protein n=1 Tax=Coccomyxa viridis TaxID=1274662 RepID=A0ABP1FSY7_9CHLO
MTHNSAALLSVSLILAFTVVSHGASIITTNGTQFVDDVGRVVVLRGLNLPADAKLPDFMPLKVKTPLHVMQLYGANVARVLFTWEAFEPNRGNYSMEYLDYYLGLVEALYKQGVYTLVDMHQDFYSRWLNKGCGEGFPQWAVLVNPLLTKPPTNGVFCTAWILQGPFDLSTWLNWYMFYQGSEGVRNSFLDMWEYLAERFADNPAILGYDMLNEPFGDEVKQISPLYEDIAARIRKHDQKAILFIEPQIYAGAGGDIALKQPTFSNYAMAAHYYGQTRKKFVVFPFDGVIKRWKAQMDSWNAPLWFGEFGANNDPNPDNVQFQAPNYIAMVYDELDKYLLGGTQWGWTDNWTPANHDGWNQENFSITDQRRQIRSNYAIRAYPQAIAGTPGTFKIDSKYRVLDLDWVVTDAALSQGSRGATTEIFAPVQGFFQVATVSDLQIKVTSSVKCTYAADLLMLNCLATQPGNVTLHIEPVSL